MAPIRGIPLDASEEVRAAVFGDGDWEGPTDPKVQKCDYIDGIREATWHLWQELQSFDWDLDVRPLDQLAHAYRRVEDREIYLGRWGSVERIRAFAAYEPDSIVRAETGRGGEEYRAAHHDTIYSGRAAEAEARPGSRVGNVVRDRFGTGRS